MDIKSELLSKAISEWIIQELSTAELNTYQINNMVNTYAVNALSEIKNTIKNESLSDFEMIDEIVNIFEKYNISSGGCHDFG